VALDEAALRRATPLGRGVEILTMDANGLVALNKPAGVLSHPNRPGEEKRSLLTASYALNGEVYTWPEAEGGATHQLWLLNRLDSATSGVILLATSAELAEHIRAQFRRQHIDKRYSALVFGRPNVTRDVWQDRLAVQKQGGRIRTGGGGNIPAECAMTVLRSAPGPVAPLALLELAPRTGRSHQLRVQCARRHLPIVGDATYGDFKLNRAFAKTAGTKRLFLHSQTTAFEYQWVGRSHRFVASAPLPVEFDAVLRG